MVKLSKSSSLLLCC